MLHDPLTARQFKQSTGTLGAPNQLYLSLWKLKEIDSRHRKIKWKKKCAWLDEPTRQINGGEAPSRVNTDFFSHFNLHQIIQFSN